MTLDSSLAPSPRDRRNRGHARLALICRSCTRYTNFPRESVSTTKFTSMLIALSPPLLLLSCLVSPVPEIRSGHSPELIPTTGIRIRRTVPDRFFPPFPFATLIFKNAVSSPFRGKNHFSSMLYEKKKKKKKKRNARDNFYYGSISDIYFVSFQCETYFYPDSDRKK